MSEPISNDMAAVDYTDPARRSQQNSQISRQREQDGARASCCEISPERPESMHQENKTTYLAHQSSEPAQQLDDTIEEGKSPFSSNTTAIMSPSTMDIQKKQIPPEQMVDVKHVQPPMTISSHLSSLPNSPLKPSQESLLDHYKYEKHNKTNSITEMLNASETSKILDKAAQKLAAPTEFAKQSKTTISPAKIEEPKIISKSTVGKGGYGVQSSGSKVTKQISSTKKKR